MEFQDVVRQRYACKKFDGRRVPQEAMEELLELIRLTPSGLNLQPWKIKVVADQAAKEELGPVSASNQPQVTSCSHLLVICANTDLDDVVRKAEDSMRGAGVPDEVREHILELANSHRAKPYEQRLVYTTNQCFLALGTAVNGAKALGLDSCPMTTFDKDEYCRILSIPGHVVPVALCAVGYAAGDAPATKRRLPREEIFF